MIRTGFRKGDGAEMAMIEFVISTAPWYLRQKASEVKQASKRKTRRSKTKKTEDGANNESNAPETKN